MRIFLLVYVLIIFSFIQCSNKAELPSLYIIGDSTVKNGQGDGAEGLWGWGDFIPQYFDTTKIHIENHAKGGTSSRTFQSLGLWKPVFEKLKPGDFVFMQFGHNDAGDLNDDSRARGTIKGIGEEYEEIDNLLTGEHEIVHSYGWYMRKFIHEAKLKGAIPVIFSPIPRNDWVNERVPRNNIDNYGAWAKQVAEIENIQFIDLNDKMVNAMEKSGEENVTETYFFKRDHTHTTAKGAVLSASLVVEGLKEASLVDLKKYLSDDPQITLPAKKKVFLIGDSTVADGKETIIGWGKKLPGFFIEQCVTIINKARGGRSSRTFSYEGLWQESLDMFEPGDVVIIQFGHNDGGNIDKEKYRGSLKGIGNETQEVTRPDSTIEIVHSYGWYMKKYISETKAKGAIPIVISQPPRNIWNNGKVERVAENYGLWAKQAAEEEGCIFIDINGIVASKYEELGSEQVATFFTNDHTHTNETGAYLNALTIAEQLRKCKELEIRKYIIIPKQQ